MNRKKISMRKARALKEWLDLPGSLKCDICPFEDYITCQLCKDSFPNLPKRPGLDTRGKLKYVCPCHAYSKLFVIKEARRYMKEAGL